MRQVVEIKVCIMGSDGYLGWTLAQHLGIAGHEISGIDNFSRRGWVAEMDSHTAIPIENMATRLQALSEVYGVDVDFHVGDLTSYMFVKRAIERIKPDCIVHFGEQPSAPFSMKSPWHATFTHNNNLNGTLNILYAMKEHAPKCHLLKLGTMGEFGQPNIDIPEGFFEIEYRGRKDTLPFPKQAGSWYHQTKVHDTNNIMFACKTWGLSSTDIMQGVVYGTQIDTMTDPRLRTRFDFDEAFGTALNRFCAQAVIGHPLTPYGSGDMVRGFIALRDSMKCLEIAMKNPPQEGEYRVFNQFDETYSIYQLAEHVKDAGLRHNLQVKIQNIDNPRTEKEKHYYNPDSNKLRELGFKPTKTLSDELDIILKDLIEHRERIESKKHVILPKIKWSEGK